MLAADKEFARWRHRQRCRRRWGRWRRWNARRAAEARGEPISGLSALSPAWRPASHSARSRRMRRAAVDRAWHCGGFSAGGDPAALLPASAPPSPHPLLVRPALTKWCDRTALRMTQSHDAPAAATPAHRVEPLLVKDLRGLLNHLLTSDTIDAYMAILQRSRPWQICFVTSYVSALFINGLSSRWVARAASLVQATPKLFIPWHIPTGMGHYIHGIADFSTGRLEVFDPLHPQRRGTASGRHVTRMRRFVAAVAAVSGHEHVWTVAWGHTGKQSGVDCGVHVMHFLRGGGALKRPLPTGLDHASLPCGRVGPSKP